MKAIMAEEIEQRGLAVVDELIGKGDLHIDHSVTTQIERR